MVEGEQAIGWPELKRGSPIFKDGIDCELAERQPRLEDSKIDDSNSRVLASWELWCCCAGRWRSWGSGLIIINYLGTQVQ